MHICGFEPLTLLDYPGKLAATLFLGGCNFRCPFCQNKDLVLSPASVPDISIETVLTHLKKRQGILEGVCITGGEPTLTQDLWELTASIKELGYQIKLDTNGSNPKLLKDLVSHDMIDHVAMDIKTSRKNYPSICGVPDLDIAPILESVDFLLQNNVSYEFRTTVVAELHGEEDFKDIALWLENASCTYFLQQYKDSPSVIQTGFTPPSLESLRLFQSIVTPYIRDVQLRGVDGVD